MSEQAIDPRGNTFFVAINRDPPRAFVVHGLGAMERVLKELFYGPDILTKTSPLIEEHNARWENFCDLDNWCGHFDDRIDLGFEWGESGEDYNLKVFRITDDPVKPDQGIYK